MGAGRLVGWLDTLTNKCPRLDGRRRQQSAYDDIIVIEHMPAGSQPSDAVRIAWGRTLAQPHTYTHSCSEHLCGIIQFSGCLLYVLYTLYYLLACWYVNGRLRRVRCIAANSHRLSMRPESEPAMHSRTHTHTHTQLRHMFEATSKRQPDHINVQADFGGGRRRRREEDCVVVCGCNDATHCSRQHAHVCV